ncbi:hypothetical protein PybrP1_011881 [[Pythium] brassicae (nom. inval.)]|nr:hypothetical protein PybrP1_011881 [[Pythium] brassicae (nom. inval.)]
MSSVDGEAASPEEAMPSMVEKRLLSTGWGDEDPNNDAGGGGGDDDDDEQETPEERVSTRKHKFGGTHEGSDDGDEAADDGPAETPKPASYTWRRADGKDRNQQNDDKEEGEGGDEEDDDDDEDDGSARFLRNAGAGGARPIPSGIDDLPLFADDKNKELHKKIRAKEKQFQSVKSDLTENKSRVEIMTEHLKNVKQELLHTQELHGAKLKEVASEEHMKQLAEREVGRIAQEMRKIDAECADLEAKLSAIQSFLFKGNEAMDKFKMQMNWNQDEMEQWATAAKQKEDDALALERYRRADESKIKELSLEIEKLTRKLQQHRRALEDEATETQAKQIELDKTADEFRQLHDERQRLVQQWQATIEAMQRRDEEIAAASEQFALARQGLQAKRDVLAAHKHRLKQQEQENSDTQAKISGKERQQSRVQQELQTAVARLQEFKDQVEILRNQLASAVAHLNQQRSLTTHKDGLLEGMKQELESARARFKATRGALDKCLSSTADAETVAKEAEADLGAMEGELRRAEKEIGLQKELMFRKSQQLFALRQKEAGLVADIAGSKAAVQNLRAKLKALDQQTLRQQELVYNGEFQIQQMERKVARASGERSAEETKVLQGQIQVLQMELDRVRAEAAMLQAQCKKLEEEKRAQERVKKALAKQREEVAARIAECELANESCAGALRQALREKEELLVQHDLQALEAKRLRALLNLRADEVFSLENRDFQLKKSMEERKREIAVHRELQRATNRGAEDERHKVSVELAERESRVRKLQAKFETLCKMSGYGGGEDAGGSGEERSQAYFVIKAAQRRDELQREGDDLDDKIRVAEKEVRALKRTLQHLEEQNSDYRKSFHRADLAGDDAQRLAALEDQAKQAEDAFFKKKKELARAEMDLESEAHRLREVETQRQFARENALQLESARQQVDREVLGERAKWDKAVKKLDRLLREHHKFVGGAVPREQLVLEAYNFKELSSSLLYTLGQLAHEFPEISDALGVAVREHGLVMPAMPPGRTAAARASQAAAAGGGGDLGLPRPMSARSDRSDRSLRSFGSNASQRSGGSGASVRVAAPVSKVRIGF